MRRDRQREPGWMKTSLKNKETVCLNYQWWDLDQVWALEQTREFRSKKQHRERMLGY